MSKQNEPRTGEEPCGAAPHLESRQSTEARDGQGDATMRRAENSQKRRNAPQSAASDQPQGDESDFPGLTACQAEAVRLLTFGTPVAHAAQAIGVNRSTLFRWLEQDQFKALLNRGRQDRQTAIQTQLEMLAQRAVNAVAGRLDGGGDQTGMQLLKGLGFLPGVLTKIDSSDPKALAAARRNRSQYDEIIKALDASVEKAIHDCID